MEIYVNKNALNSYVVLPVPKDLENYYKVEVDSYPHLTKYSKFDIDSYQFIEELPDELYLTTQKNIEIASARKAQYTLRVDPLTMEAIIKQAMGQDTSSIFQAAYEERLAIQNELPFI